MSRPYAPYEARTHNLLVLGGIAAGWRSSPLTRAWPTTPRTASPAWRLRWATCRR